MISFIVPAYNEEALIGLTLTALAAAARNLDESHEIIVADDDSSDQTRAIAKRLGARVTTASHRQIAATRNEGAKAASGDKLFFVDADTCVNEAVINAAIQAMREGVVGGGCNIHFDGRIPRWAQFINPVFMRGYRAMRLAGGCFLFCTREAFDAVGGFDEDYFGAEEVIMSGALKKIGRFVILREFVITSGRKLRTHSGREFLSTLVHFALNGRGSVKRREGMEMWYGERRNDPGVRAGELSELQGNCDLAGLD